mmetsp:Transcript_899/g.3138  ORF Transcript_899/g.3138 Transcript_899/m.3138 type:complete len:243 (-) Transcript_899:16-744(-)
MKFFSCKRLSMPPNVTWSLYMVLVVSCTSIKRLSTRSSSPNVPAMQGHSCPCTSSFSNCTRMSGGSCEKTSLRATLCTLISVGGVPTQSPPRTLALGSASFRELHSACGWTKNFRLCPDRSVHARSTIAKRSFAAPDESWARTLFTKPGVGSTPIRKSLGSSRRFLSKSVWLAVPTSIHTRCMPLGSTIGGTGTGLGGSASRRRPRATAAKRKADAQRIVQLPEGGTNKQFPEPRCLGLECQ